MLDLNLEADDPNAAAVTLNFSILNSGGNGGGEAIGVEDEDEAGDDVIFRRGELQLFPLDTAASSSSSCSGRPGFRGYKCWLDLSLPESDRVNPPAKKSRRGPRSRSSQYRGVTFYRRTGRWESHIWDCGKQVYLGGFDTAQAAARAYDRAAIRFRGVDADINFSIVDYEEDMKQMNNFTKEEFVQVLRRQVNGSAHGGSKYRGVAFQKYDPRLGQSQLKIRAYDKEAPNRFFRTNSSYDRDMKISSKDGGSQCGLDLKLGISLSSNTSLNFPYASSLGDGKGIKNDQETAVGIRGDDGSPFLDSSNWSSSYKMESAIKSNVPQRLLSSAASSGFSCATTSPFFASRAQFTKTAFSGLQRPNAHF